MTSAIITGATRGIGRALAVRLNSLAYRLVLLGRDQQALAAVASACEHRANEVHCIAGDLQDESYIDAAFHEACERFGHIDVLVNNAGVARREPAQHADLDAWWEVLNVNFKAAVRLTHLALPAMIEKRAGAIINISSISGRHVSPGSAIYAATKHALNGFSGCTFEDVRDYGIKVSLIMPGFVATDLTAGLGRKAARMLQPTDVADAVEFVLSSSPTCCPTELVLRPQRTP